MTRSQVSQARQASPSKLLLRHPRKPLNLPRRLTLQRPQTGPSSSTLAAERRWTGLKNLRGKSVAARHAEGEAAAVHQDVTGAHQSVIAAHHVVAAHQRGEAAAVQPSVTTAVHQSEAAAVQQDVRTGAL